MTRFVHILECFGWGLFGLGLGRNETLTISVGVLVVFLAVLIDAYTGRAKTDAG